MKLDKKYIIDKVDKLIYSIDWEWNSPNEKVFEAIVKSIIRDCFNAGADAQMEKCIKEIREMKWLYSKEEMDEFIAAISSATVEFPHE